MLEQIRSSHLARVAVRAVGVVAAAAVTLTLGTVVFPLLGIGAIAAGIAEVVSMGITGAAIGCLLSRNLPVQRVSGSTGLRRLGIAAAIAGGICLAATTVGIFVIPVAAHAIGAAAALLVSGAAGAAIAGTAWTRFTDVPMAPGTAEALLVG